MGAADHHAQAQSQGSVPIAVVTVSDTRTLESDESGRLIRAVAESAGHAVVDYRIVRDEPDEVQQALEDFLGGEARVVIFNGGTGVSQRDRTYDVVSRAIEKPLPGFGELFRMLSYQEVGAAAMLSRATAGVCGGKIEVSLPGSPAAVRLALEKLLLPELRHLVWELGK